MRIQTIIASIYHTMDTPSIKESFGRSFGKMPFEVPPIVLSGAINLDKYAPYINVIDNVGLGVAANDLNSIKLKYKLKYIDDGELDYYTSLSYLASKAKSGGISATISYSATLRQIIGNIATIKMIVSDYLEITIKMIIIAIEQYNDNDPCFPFECGKSHD